MDLTLQESIHAMQWYPQFGWYPWLFYWTYPWEIPGYCNVLPKTNLIGG